MEEIDFNKLMVSADEILPGLWLGNEASSQSVKFMQQRQINLIVNATKNVPSRFLGHIHYLRIPTDNPGVSRILRDDPVMQQSLKIVLPWIHRMHRKNKHILIHCHSGIQRSATVMAAYLIYAGIATDFASAVELIVKKRPIAFLGGRSFAFRL